MPRTPDTRPEREIAPEQLDAIAPSGDPTSPRPRRASGRSASSSGSRKQTTSEAGIIGIVGDASATVTRSGEDERRRGWFWHWNNIVTQYAPLIGLKGVGLINSYTVWTDRRENSPHRGYAFPSQQSEADFYGEDRAELITINKILVALDLIEIRKEMVPRTDEQGRRWKVPHNLYRVKDHSDDFHLTSRDVMTVVHLADKDRTVYRYVRRMFSPKFSPIDSQNVWHAILEEVRQDPTWQKLAEKTERDETKASARSKAGHVSRRANGATGPFSLPDDSDNPEPESTGGDSRNDSETVEKPQGEATVGTSVAKTNKGSATSDEQRNNGLADIEASSVDGTNTAPPTTVPPSNTMYYQELTTTTTTDTGTISTLPGNETGNRPPPDSSRDEDEALRCFEEANNRSTTPAERRLLRQLAQQFDPAANTFGQIGWQWLTLAIDDAVAAGSAFVAPRRVSEILSRWEREGLPQEYRTRSHGSDDATRAAPKPVTTGELSSHRSLSQPAEALVGEIGAEPFVAPIFVVEACGLTNRQLWSAVMGELQSGGRIGVADIATWLREVAILEATDRTLMLGVPHELARRRVSSKFVTSIRSAIEQVCGVRFELEVVLFREWVAA